MAHPTTSRRPGIGLLALAVVVLALLVAPSFATATVASPTITIVGDWSISLDPPPTEAVSAISEPGVTLLVDDGGWGADQVRFSNDGGATWDAGVPVQTYMSWYLYGGKSAELRLDGLCTVTAQFSNDDGETWGPVASAATLFDGQAPVVTAPQGYWNNHYPYKLSARDQVGLSGVQYLWYRVDAGELVQVTSGAALGTSLPLKAAVTLAGKTGTPHSVDFFAGDFAGNISGRILAVRGAKAMKKGDIISLVSSAYVVIDRSAPSVTARGWDDRWHSNAVAIRFSARDRGGAGLAGIQYSVTRAGAKHPGAWTTGNSATVSREGVSRVWYRAIDAAQPKGNASAARSVVVKVR